MASSNSEHLQWIHDRIVNEYGESHDVDFLIRFRTIIAETKASEEGFKEYMEYVRTQRNKKVDIDTSPDEKT